MLGEAMAALVGIVWMVCILYLLRKISDDVEELLECFKEVHK